MAKRFTPTLECLEARQALAASPALAGMAAAAPNLGPALTMLLVPSAPFGFQNGAGAVAPTSAAGSSAGLTPSDSPQPPSAASAGDDPAASPIAVAVSSSPPATAPSGASPENSSSPDRGDQTLTANAGGLSKDVPLAQGKSAAPTNSASAEDRFAKKADEFADRLRAGLPSPLPGGQEAWRPNDAGALPEPPGGQGGEPPKGIGGSERASPDWPKHLPRLAAR